MRDECFDDYALIQFPELHSGVLVPGSASIFPNGGPALKPVIVVLSNEFRNAEMGFPPRTHAC
jgi:hypothetical protein